MKKLIALLLVLSLLVSLSGCAFAELSLLYSERSETEGFSVGINPTANCAFAGTYTCAEYTENMELIIPESCDGVPVKRIGGYFGRGVAEPFAISLAELYMNAPQGSKYASVFSGNIEDYTIPETYRVENVPFRLHIGGNIDTVARVEMDRYYPHLNADGSVTFYHPVVHITCAAENEHFYAKDGKLYEKKSDTLIYGFAYAEP